MKKKSVILLSLILIVCTLLLISCDQKDDDVTLTGIEIRSMPDQTVYNEGDAFDKTGLRVVAMYSDGSHRVISAYKIDKDILRAGDTEVVISYKNFSEKVGITVIENRPVSLVIEKMPDKTTYYENDAFDPAGLTLCMGYENGSKCYISGETCEYDKNILSLSDTSVKALWCDLSCEIPIRVIPLPTNIVGIRIDGTPVKTVYCEGEKFDPTGLKTYLLNSDGTQTQLDIHEFTFSKANNGTVHASFSVFSQKISVKTVSGTAQPFVFSYSEEQYRQAISSHTKLHADSVTLENPFGNKSAAYSNLLHNPCPDGIVKSRAELKDYIDYHAFYYVDSIIVKPDYAFTDFDKELDYVYYNASMIASMCAIDYSPLTDGWYQVRLKFYTDTLVSFANADVTVPDDLTYPSAVPTRKSFASTRVDFENGVTVYDSEQLCAALAKGYKVAPISGSPAEKALLRAYEILTEYCSDTMDEHEKMFAIAKYFLTVRYDMEGETEWASRILSTSEPDMLTSQLVSFHADGPLFYGNAACFGYAKAFGLLLSLEDIDFIRVVGRSAETMDRIPFDYDPVSGYNIDGGFSYHSYLYVRIDGKDYIADGTYAFAGSVPAGGRDVVIYRQLGIGLTKEAHSEVYSSNIDDYSRSAAYRPDPSYDYLARMTYDGKSTYLIETAADLASALDYYKNLALASDASCDTFEILLYVNGSLIQTHDVYADIDHFGNTFAAWDNYVYYGIQGNSHNGKPYTEYLLILTR